MRAIEKIVEDLAHLIIRQTFLVTSMIVIYDLIKYANLEFHLIIFKTKQNYFSSQHIIFILRYIIRYSTS